MVARKSCEDCPVWATTILTKVAVLPSRLGLGLPVQCVTQSWLRTITIFWPTWVEFSEGVLVGSCVEKCGPDGKHMPSSLIYPGEVYCPAWASHLSGMMRRLPKTSQSTGCHFLRPRQFLPDPLSRTILDPLHSEEEERLVILGQSGLRHTLVVVHTYRGEVIRIISARPATSRERRDYERGKE